MSILFLYIRKISIKQRFIAKHQTPKQNRFSGLEKAPFYNKFNIRATKW